MLTAIMTSPEFAEVCFLVAFILFVIATVLRLVASKASVWSGAFVAAGLSFSALGVLAL